MERERHVDLTEPAPGEIRHYPHDQAAAPAMLHMPYNNKFIHTNNHPPLRVPHPRKVKKDFPYMAAHELSSYERNYARLKEAGKAYTLSEQGPLKFFTIQAKLCSIYESQPPPPYTPKSR